ncbi:hypothetical protein KUF54_06410 [Comamonas sp. Y33R10-2]|uniref:hypothetical protein n=1 Tax=Comamonas sp. Y33R10-2 TaxID=2853257 RepID=UPI001C5CC054|nr:hypothetical protein [Comamonas sp. Y33R10-2]QXZ10832.1 hypothetical protein KUF54_06410 [Comamonas sp. Y33R10-2]
MNSSPELTTAESLVKPAGLPPSLWDDATLEQKQMLSRISRQRSRIKGRASAKAQALALRETQPTQVDSNASLPERLLTFVRLHPVATAAAGALLMVIGPRKLIRWGTVAMPWVMKLQQRDRS